MGYQLGLAGALRARGLAVEEYAGWTSRGSSSFNPAGAVCHWTAGPCDATGRPSLNTVVNGRADLAGPLANVYLDRAGVAVVVAAGRANHAGDGSWCGLSGNSTVFGTEAECCNAGDWTDAQALAYPKVNAAYCDLGGFGPDMVCGHNEWAAGRKIDVYDWPPDAMRSQVAALVAGEDADMSYTDADRARDDDLAASAVTTGPLGVTRIGGCTTVFWIDANGRLVHRWYDHTGRWQVDYPLDGLDPECGVAVVPDNGGLAQVFAFTDSGDVVYAQYNPNAGRWETGRITEG